MKRIEYTIDGKFWNPISIDFPDYASINSYIENAGIREFAKTIKILTVTKEEKIEVRKN